MLTACITIFFPKYGESHADRDIFKCRIENINPNCFTNDKTNLIFLFPFNTHYASTLWVTIKFDPIYYGGVCFPLLGYWIRLVIPNSMGGE